MTATTQCCGSTSTTCSTEAVLRPRFFPRQIITPDDLTLMQDYFRARMRSHNLIMHGWGVACGALVCPMPATDGSGPMPWTVVVRRGYMIGPCGDEIILDCERTIDLRTAGVTGVTGDACVEMVDPWCADVYQSGQPKTVWIAVRYQEVMTRPVRVQPHGCGCNDSQCEYSRWRDGYEIGVLNSCPCPPTDPAPDFDRLHQGSTSACPCVPATSWVGLAAVNIDSDGTILSIDNCSCRRLIVSFGNFWWKCSADQSVGQLAADASNKPLKPNVSTPLIFSGKGIQQNAKVALGSDINISGVTISSAGDSISFTAQPNANADTSSPRELVVTNPDCTWVTLTGAVTFDSGTTKSNLSKRTGTNPNP